METSTDSSVADARASAMHKQTIRNRENQRNFRLRRQQRVQELEEKLMQCQLARIEATQEVQNAARLVVAENAILKKFLREELNFDEKAIIDLLQRGRQEQTPVSVDSRRQPPAAQHTADIVPKGVTGNATLPPSPESSIQPLKVTSTATHNAHQGQNRGRDLRAEIDARNSTAQSLQSTSNNVRPTDILSDPTSLFTTTETVLVNNEIGSQSSMSCEKAAEILSSLRSPCGQEDIRMQLGCKSSASCVVNNVHLLEVMSEAV